MTFQKYLIFFSVESSDSKFSKNVYNFAYKNETNVLLTYSTAGSGAEVIVISQKIFTFPPDFTYTPDFTFTPDVRKERL
jgi:hypothetical protein